MKPTKELRVNFSTDYSYRSAFASKERLLQSIWRTLNQSSETYFKPLIIEKMVETIKSYCSDKWIDNFENRYMDFGKIGTSGAGIYYQIIG